MSDDFERRLAWAQRDLQDAKKRRDALIIAASEAGMSRREVAAAIGMTAAGVQHVIATRRPKNAADAGRG